MKTLKQAKELIKVGSTFNQRYEGKSARNLDWQKFTITKVQTNAFFADSAKVKGMRFEMPKILITSLSENNGWINGFSDPDSDYELFSIITFNDINTQ